MKKQILKLGKALNKVEQKSINGGGYYCKDQPCPEGHGYTCIGWNCILL